MFRVYFYEQLQTLYDDIDDVSSLFTDDVDVVLMLFCRYFISVMTRSLLTI